MSIVQEHQHQPIFESHISYIHSEIDYFESLLNEKRQKAEKMENIQGLASTILRKTSINHSRSYRDQEDERID